jgi:DNA-binding SARP family transcriptional activator
MPKIDFRILGPLEVRVDERPIRLHGMKSQIVLSSPLIAKSRHASIPHLIDAVWDAVPVPLENRTAS